MRLDLPDSRHAAEKAEVACAGRAEGPGRDEGGGKIPAEVATAQGGSTPALLCHKSGTGWWIELDGRRISPQTYRMQVIQGIRRAKNLELTLEER